MSGTRGTVALTVARRELFRALTDAGTWPEWNVVHGSFIDDPPSSLAVGTAFSAKLVLLEVPDVLRWRVVDLRPPVSLGLEGRGSAGSGRITYTLDEQGTGVAVGYEIGATFPGSRFGPLRSLADDAVHLLAGELEYSLRRLEAHALGVDVDTVQPPRPRDGLAAASRSAATMARVAKRLVGGG